jgi:Uri superfamily endonuclease
MGRMKGSYILLIELAVSRAILVGKLGYVSFPNASYAYVGSAMNGLRARLARHLREQKKLHWHIDYLLKEAEIEEIILYQGEERVECFLAQILAGEFQSVPGFGSSDCKCRSHLYFASETDRLKASVAEAVKQTGLAYDICSKGVKENGTRI